MKVGILTFHLGPNYGGFLQAYCLQEAIKALGHEVEVINYKNHGHHASERFRPWIYRRPHRLWGDFRKRRAFRRAFQSLSLSDFTTEPERVPWDSYDAIVVGSDIVWNCRDSRLGRDPVYFGKFTARFRGKLVAYAPSIGSMDPSHAAPDWVSQGLAQFDSIAVRDEATQLFVHKQIGRTVPLVVDPTWLIDAERPGSVGGSGVIPGDYVLIYALRLEGENANAIRSFAQRNGLLTVAPGHWQSWADVNMPQVDPFQWVDVFHNAKHAVVGTFHGGLYCIREELQFAVARHPEIDAKLATPLALTGLADRRIECWDDLETTLHTPIDYETVGARRKDYVNKSLSFLKEALSR